MLVVSYEYPGLNPFEWNAFRCPVCRRNQYTSETHAAVHCLCGAQFRVRPTCGDPGCVVDCFVHPLLGGRIYAPAWECSECGARTAWFDHEPPRPCPANSHHQEMMKIKGVEMPWNPPPGFPDFFYLILKVGGYCSGWMDGRGPAHGQLPFPTQEEWEEYQREILGKGR